MKVKFAVAAALIAFSSLAAADQYVCSVNCVNPTGKAAIEVNAGSPSDAAQKVDKQSDQICQAAGHGKSTSATMSASQCSRK